VTAITILFLFLTSQDVTGGEVTESFLTPSDMYLRLYTFVPQYAPPTPLYGANTSCLETLWDIESGWQEGRLNPSSLACGISQALPCTNIYPNFYEMEREWRNGKYYLVNPNRSLEIEWGLNYIEERYGDACAALEFHRLNNYY